MCWKFGANWSRNGRAKRNLGRWAKGLRGLSVGEGPRVRVTVLARMGLDWGSQALGGLSNRRVEFISCKLQKNWCFLVKDWAIYGVWPKEAAILDWTLLIETGEGTLFDFCFLDSEWELRENKGQLLRGIFEKMTEPNLMGIVFRDAARLPLDFFYKKKF